MKACPGLRSGIDCSGSLSFAIRGIPSSIRPPIRHLYENAPTRLSSAPLNPSIRGIPSSIRPLNSSFPRRRESRWEVRVVAMTLELSHQPMHPNFHTLVCPQQPA